MFSFWGSRQQDTMYYYTVENVSCWQMQCGTLNLKPYQSQAKLSLVVPVSASCIMLEFASFWQNLSASSAEVLQCPRCSQIVSHPQGYCRYCKENAYQCRHCRSPSASSTLSSVLCMCPLYLLCLLYSVLCRLFSNVWTLDSLLCFFADW